MKLKSENNIIKLQKGNRLALFQKAVNAVQNRDAQALQEVNDEATLIEQEDRRRAYNQLHQLPQDTRFIPSNEGTITEHEGPLYNNKFEKVLDDTAKGQLAVRMADTLKKGVGLGFAVAGGNWLLNGLKVAPFLTSMELLGGATAGKLGKSIGKRIDNKLHTHNQIVDFEKALPFISMIGGAKGARSWFENNTIRGAIESGFQNLKFIPAQVKYYGPTMGKSYAAKTNDNLIDLDTWGKPEYNKLAKKYGYKDWREMILSDKGDYNAEYKALIKDQIKRIQSNPQYSGKTIIVSNASFLNPNSGIEFASTPVIPEREIMAQRNNTRHPWESIEHGEKWWDSLNQKGTPLKIDNRFVSEIEGNKVIEYTPKLDLSSTYHFDPRVKPLSKPVTEVEKHVKLTPEELYKLINGQSKNGFYFLGHGTGRNNPEIESFFKNGLRVKDGDITNTTIPISKSSLEKWPHLDSENIIILPSRTSAIKTDGYFGNIPTDFFDSQTFHWTDHPKTIGKGLLAVTEPNASFTPVERIGLKSIFTKPEAVWASYNTKTGELRINPNSQYKFSILSELERLGVPKGERSNIKALEDPQYWGYKQWNQRYNAAVESGNWDEVQRLRDLHFKIKAPNSPQYNFYHGTFNKDKPFYVFEPQSNNELFFHFSPYKDTAEKFMGIAKTGNKNGRLITAKLNIQRPITVTDSGWWNWYRIPEANPRIAKTLGMDGATAGQYYSDLLLKEPSVSEANGKMMDMINSDAFMYRNYTEDTGRISIAVPRPTQIKLADPITRTNTGEIIPIVKRDNFRNLDIRYKQGGIIKGQLGLSNLPVNPNVIKRTYDKVNSFLNPISKWESKHNVKANASLGPLMWLENPEAFAGLDLETIDPAHVGAKFVRESLPIKEIPSISKASKTVVRQPVTKMEKGLHTYVKNKHPEDLDNWEKYLDEYMKYWTKKKK